MKLRYRLRYALCMVMVLFITVSLCGCDLFAVDTAGLLSPPEPSGDMSPIQKALSASVEGEFSLKYPSAGDRRSAFILEDIDADNSFEAFAFYSTVVEDTTYMNVNLILSRDGEWRSVGSQSIVAGGIEMVDFCDLDGDGASELIVGWEIYSSTEKQLAVYSCSKDGLSQRMLKQYTNFLCCDLDENGEYEVFVHLLDTAGGVNTASLIAIADNGITEIAGCLMDKTVKSCNKPIIADLSSGQPAVYIDEIKGAGAVTEVLCFSKGSLVNPLLDSLTTENTKTLRSSSLFVKDINHDGILEIPVSAELPSAKPLEKSDRFYYTCWCSFNGDSLTPKDVTVMNLTDGYYIDVPQKWEGNIALSRNTEEHLRTVYAYDNVNFTTGETLAYFRVVSAEEWAKGSFAELGYIEICRREESVYIGKALTTGTALSVTEDELKGILKLIEE